MGIPTKTRTMVKFEMLMTHLRYCCNSIVGLFLESYRGRTTCWSRLLHLYRDKLLSAPSRDKAPYKLF